MNPRRVWTTARYEIRRAAARKKVLALVILTLLIETIPYYLLKETGSSILPPGVYSYVWTAGVFLPEGFFIPFMALLIAAGSMSEEYEQGTAEVMLSKPVSRDEYFSGKYLGGFLLLAMVVTLGAILSVASATFTFGAQMGLEIIPAVIVAQLLGSTIFYSVAFMSGELVRRSSLSYIVASAVYFTSEVAGIYLGAIYELTGKAFYHQIDLYLPTSPVGSLPLLLGEQNLPQAASPILRVLRAVGLNSTETSVPFSVALVLAYVAFAVVVARFYFNRADIAKKIS